ncbi:MAG: glycosyltransferase [Magnetococcales bacterium]|nr:glycosyltransferase [Magnetococcales bacterium]
MVILMGFRTPFLSLDEALTAQGVTLLPWKPGAPLPTGLERVDGALLDLADAARHLMAVFRLSRILRRAGRPMALLNRDAPWNKGVRRRRLWALGRLRVADLLLTHALQNDPALARRTVYFPNAADINRYHLHGVTLEALRTPEYYRHAVSFIGNIDDARYPEHRPRMHQLRTLRDRLATLGIPLELFHGPDLTVAQQVEVIQRSRINLNLGAACDHGGERSWGLPERCYGIPACGGFLLSDHRQHADFDFTPETEWRDFTTLDSCVTAIQTLHADLPRTRRIAEAAHQRVMTQHTYAQRARTLREQLGKHFGEG